MGKKVIRKLIKPYVAVGQDEVLKDVIESLALFYDPALMAEYGERLLMNSNLSSVFSACLKTSNMKFFKAYSSMLHNKIMAYVRMDKKSMPTMIRCTDDSKLVDIDKYKNGAVLTKLRLQYSMFLNTFISSENNHKKAEMLNAHLDNLRKVIIDDVEAGVMYDNINMYITLMNTDYTEIIDELNNIVMGDDTPNDECLDDDVQFERYSKLYNLFEGNHGVINRMVNYRYYPNNEHITSTEDMLNAYADNLRTSVTRGMILLEDMMFHLKDGLTPMQNVVNKLDECGVYLDDSSSIATIVPANLKGELSECLEVIDVWLAEGVSKKLRWRSAVADCGKFNRVPVLSPIDFKHGMTVEDVIERGRMLFVGEMVSSYLANILESMPFITTHTCLESQLDILKVITDALDVDITIHVKIKLQSLYMTDYGISMNETEDTYLRAWTTELYKALQDVTVDMTDKGLALDTYYNLKNYKNTNEN